METVYKYNKPAFNSMPGRETYTNFYSAVNNKKKSAPQIIREDLCNQSSCSKNVCICPNAFKPPNDNNKKDDICKLNTNMGKFSRVVSGSHNINLGNNSAIVSGNCNLNIGNYSQISGGQDNIISCDWASISGGRNNNLYAPYTGSVGGENLDVCDAHSVAVGKNNLSGENRLFMVGNGNIYIRDHTSQIDRHNVFSTYSNGNGYIENALFLGTGTDYAIYMESDNGQAIDVGTSVIILPNGKIRAAVAPEQPIGVITNNAAIVTNSYEEYWHGKYMTDDEGNILYQTIQVKKEVDVCKEKTVLKEEYVRECTDDGPVYYLTTKPIMYRVPKYTKVPLLDEKEEIIGYIYETQKQCVVCDETVRIINPDYDPCMEYIPRSQRPEWNIVGIIGIIPVKNSSPVNTNWIPLPNKPAPTGTTYYFVR